MAYWNYMKYDSGAWDYREDVTTYVRKLKTHGYEIEEIIEHEKNYRNGGYNSAVITGATITLKTNDGSYKEEEIEFNTINAIYCKKCGITVKESTSEYEDQRCAECNSSKTEVYLISLIIVNGEEAPINDYSLTPSGNISNCFPRWYSKRDTTNLSLEDFNRLTDNELLHII